MLLMNLIVTIFQSLNVGNSIKDIMELFKDSINYKLFKNTVNNKFKYGEEATISLHHL